MFKQLRKLYILPVDFSKPWWKIVAEQKGTFFLILLIFGCLQAFWSLVPFLAVYIFESHSYILCAAIFVAWYSLDLSAAFAGRLNQNFQLCCIHSVFYNAHRYLLTVDPYYHVHRSSGSILAKIDRAARGYENFLDHVTYEFAPLIIGLTTVIIVLAQYSRALASTMLLFILAIVGIGYYFTKYICPRWENRFISADDAFKTTAVENLSQVQLIRSTFSTDFRAEKLKDDAKNNMNSEAKLWHSYAKIFLTLNMIYITSLLVLSLYLIWQINSNAISTAVAIGLFLAYIQISKEITRISRLFRKTIHSLTQITDLFDFIPKFGKQGFPVLEGDQPIVRSGEISIQANQIYFDYTETKAILFNNHSFSFISQVTQQNKLYGIIGPSGSGKTTLISVLGGQLQPRQGSIFINNIDIYKVGDATRRQLIALQGQVATNMRGTVRDNLLLGIPAMKDQNFYNDQELSDILSRVGLLSVLSSHNGLDTMLGEGGLNLSGGQRQRLNFAGLYLRASYYKPAIILIDEPTRA